MIIFVISGFSMVTTRLCWEHVFKSRGIDWLRKKDLPNMYASC